MPETKKPTVFLFYPTGIVPIYLQSDMEEAGFRVFCPCVGHDYELRRMIEKHKYELDIIVMTHTHEMTIDEAYELIRKSYGQIPVILVEESHYIGDDPDSSPREKYPHTLERYVGKEPLQILPEKTENDVLFATIREMLNLVPSA